MIKIIVNKKSKEVSSGLSLIDLLNEMGIVPEKTLASVNDKVIAQSDFKNITLEEKDLVDIFSFVGGG